MRPVIGITSDYTADPQVGIVPLIGTLEQDWVMVARDYTRAVELAGGLPLVIPVVDDEQILGDVLNLIDGLLLTGGHDVDPFWYNELPRPGLGSLNPDRDRCELLLAKNALAVGLPVLGICRGIHVLNVAAGGTLYQDIRQECPGAFNHTVLGSPKWHPVHPVTVAEGTILASIFPERRLRVNSYNHQAVKTLGEGFRVSARAEDGMVEAIEACDGRFVIGVQWHPEMMVGRDRSALLLFRAFVEAANAFGNRRLRLESR